MYVSPVSLTDLPEIPLYVCVSLLARLKRFLDIYSHFYCSPIFVPYISVHKMTKLPTLIVFRHTGI